MLFVVNIPQLHEPEPGMYKNTYYLDTKNKTKNVFHALKCTFYMVYRIPNCFMNISYAHRKPLTKEQCRFLPIFHVQQVINIVLR